MKKCDRCQREFDPSEFKKSAYSMRRRRMCKDCAAVFASEIAEYRTWRTVSPSECRKRFLEAVDDESKMPDSWGDIPDLLSGLSYYMTKCEKILKMLKADGVENPTRYDRCMDRDFEEAIVEHRVHL